ncbi:MAG TPA: RnfABCDGE type electron transport complex subunit B [Steroidobacteraceae bacterium]|nr:RnfABCDGE type electron transport complex subunit B [Steroidobacteraceae bacterium]
MVTADDIDVLLPQTQCTRCGYSGCRPYAEALLAGQAPINQCPPGGAATIGALAALLQRPVLPLNPANGVEGALLVAQIDEDACIGCVRCLPPCPVDAILGAHQQMHTVVVALCTGCELCIAPCPVDCITMVPRASLAETPAAPAAHENRERCLAHNARIARRARERGALLSARKQATGAAAANPPEEGCERAR